MVFDKFYGSQFISYAIWWIRAYIKNLIVKSWSLVKIGTTQAQKKLFYKSRGLCEECFPGELLIMKRETAAFRTGGKVRSVSERNRSYRREEGVPHVIRSLKDFYERKRGGGVKSELRDHLFVGVVCPDG